MIKRISVLGMLGVLGGLSSLGCELVGGLEQATLSTAGGGGQGTSTSTGGTVNTGGATGGTTSSGGATTSSVTSCEPGTIVACYTGGDGTEGKGICHSGMQTCNPDGLGYGPCVGEQLPQPETCGNTEDEDCDGQECAIWADVFGDAAEQTPRDIAVDKEGNVIVVGVFKGSLKFANPPLISAGGYDVFVVKLDPQGKVLWNAQFGDASDQTITRVGVDGEGSVFLAGLLQGTMNFGGGSLSGKEIYLAKFNANGGFVWSQAYVASAASPPSIGVGPDGKVVMATDFLGTANFGSGTISASADRRMSLIKFGANGATPEWIKTFVSVGGVTTNHTWAAALGLDPVGSVTLSTYFGGQKINLGGSDIPEIFVDSGGSALARFDSLGNHAWSGKEGSYAAIVADPMGNRFLAGYDDADGQAPCLSAPLVKYSNVDAKEWGKAVDCPDQGVNVEAVDIASDPEGKLVVVLGLPESMYPFTLAGQFLPPTHGGSDLILGKLDTTGNYLWARRFGDDAHQRHPKVAVAPNGDIVLAAQVSGTFDVGTGPLTTNGQDLLIARFAP